MSVINDVTAAELHERLEDATLTIVDVRPLPAYNGWRLNGTARGGHIPGAVSFPLAWLDSVDAAEVERLLEAKAIVSAQDVVVYGDRLDEAQAFEARLREL